ncbi:hypothetical protein Lal_00013006 [Lupinus albus]|nr:hypothetical protein Lal_00013006 [Lupinus albus]
MASMSGAIHIFRNGLQQKHKLLLDDPTSSSLMAKCDEDVIAIIEAMDASDQQGQHGKGNSSKRGAYSWACKKRS